MESVTISVSKPKYPITEDTWTNILEKEIDVEKLPDYFQDLIKNGIPKWIVIPIYLKMEREKSMMIAYG